MPYDNISLGLINANLMCFVHFVVELWLKIFLENTSLAKLRKILNANINFPPTQFNFVVEFFYHKLNLSNTFHITLIFKFSIE